MKVIDGILATSLMTLFSYASSDRKQKNFREPEHLARMISKGRMSRISMLQGWAAHYFFGIVWTGVESFTLRRLPRKERLPTPLVFGLFSGAVAVVCWKSFFRLYRRPIPVKYSRFYRHLLLAHIVFSTCLFYLHEFRSRRQSLQYSNGPETHSLAASYSARG